MPITGLDASSAVHSRSPSRSPPDTVFRAFSSSFTTTVFSQRSMRWFGISPPQGDTEGPAILHLLHSTAIDHSATSSDLPRSWHTPVAQRALVDPQIAGDLRDGLASLDHHLHGLSLELRAEPSTLLGHGPILSVERNCPRSLVHPSAGNGGGHVEAKARRGGLIFPESHQGHRHRRCQHSICECRRDTHRSFVPPAEGG